MTCEADRGLKEPLMHKVLLGKEDVGGRGGRGTFVALCNYSPRERKRYFFPTNLMSLCPTALVEISYKENLPQGDLGLWLSLQTVLQNAFDVSILAPWIRFPWLS